MHEIIAFGVDAQLYRDGPQGPKVNAIGWLCYNGSCKGEQMLYLDRGNLVARKGPGVQGHSGQFLAILAQSHLPIDYPMLVHGKSFTIADLVEHEKADCQPGEELTFKLIGLMHYLDSDATWTSRYGEQWSIPRLITEELKQPIRGAACGGTHRLMGFSYAINKRIQRGKPMTGEFARAQKFINDYHRYTFSLQNPDGSFSTQWFIRREANPDVDRRLKTTGHIAEWLAFSLPDEELRDPARDESRRLFGDHSPGRPKSNLGDRAGRACIARPGGLRRTALDRSPTGHQIAGRIGDRFQRRRLCQGATGKVTADKGPTGKMTTDKVTSDKVTSDKAATDKGPTLSIVVEDVTADAASPSAASTSDTKSTAASSDAPRAACPAMKPVYEIAEKLPWGMPPCEIGNDTDPPALDAPDSGTRRAMPTTRCASKRPGPGKSPPGFHLTIDTSVARARESVDHDFPACHSGCPLGTNFLRCRAIAACLRGANSADSSTFGLS